MIKINSSDSTDSDVFYVEQSMGEKRPQRNNNPDILNSTELSAAPARELITISTVVSPEPQILTIDPDSIDPTIPSGYERQDPMIPLSLNDFSI